MPTRVITQITAVTLSPNPVGAGVSYTVTATVVQTEMIMVVNPLFEFPMDIGSDGLPMGTITWE